MNNIIKVREAESFREIKYTDSAIIVKDDLINSKEHFICGRSDHGNMYYSLPDNPNAVILVFGQDTDGYTYGVLIDRYCLCRKTGEVIDIPKVLVHYAFGYDLNNRHSRVSLKRRTTQEEQKNGAQMNQRLPEAVEAIRRYGKVRTLKDGKDSHHKRYVCDNRLDSLARLSKDEHKETHKEISERSHHNRMIVIGLNDVFPDYDAEQKARKQRSLKRAMQKQKVQRAQGQARV